jgi:hypothetical protein
VPKKAATEAPFDFTRSLQRLTPESFYGFVRQYPNHQGTQVYIYRVVPVIDRKQAGIENSYIDTLPGSPECPIDEEYLLRNHGSGKYHIKLSDSNKARGLTEVAKTTVEVYDPNVPPNLNPVELVVDAPGNQRFVQLYLAKGWTVNEGKLTQPAEPDSAAGKLADTVRDLAGQVASRPPHAENNSELVGLLRELVQNRDRVDPMDRAFQIAERMRPDSANAELVRTLGTLLVERANRPVDQATANPITQLKETAELLKQFGWGAGDGGGSWIQAVQALPGILQYGAMMFRELRMMRTLEVQPADPKPTPAAAPAPRQAVPETAAQPPATAENPGEPEQETDMPLPGMPFGLKDLQRLKEIGENAIDAFDRGVDGDDFAHALVCGSRDGEKTYGALFQMVPGLSEKLAPKRAQMEAWLDQFVSYGKPDEKVA